MQVELLSEVIEFNTVLKQRAGIALVLKQLWLLANGAKEGRLTGSHQTSSADVFASHRHKRAGFDIALGVYVE
jgi:hypothetical protein